MIQNWFLGNHAWLVNYTPAISFLGVSFFLLAFILIIFWWKRSPAIPFVVWFVLLFPTTFNLWVMVAPFIFALLSVVSVFTLGQAVLRFLDYKPTFLEDIGLSFGLGIGAIASLMAIFSFFSWPFVMILPIVALSFLIYSWPSFSYKNESMASRFLIFLTGAMALHPLIYVLIGSQPLSDGVFYMTNAQSMFTAGHLIPIPGKGIIGFVMQLWPAIFQGQFVLPWVRLLFPFTFLALLLVFHANLAKHTSQNRATVFTFLLSCFPIMVYHAHLTYIDLPQAYFYTVGFIYLINFLRWEEKQSLSISLPFLMLGTMVKTSGLPLALIALAVLLLSRAGKYKPFIWAAMAWIATVLLSKSCLGRVYNVGDGNFLTVSFPNILIGMVPRLTNYADWGLLWLALPTFAVINRDRFKQPWIKYAGLIILFNLAMVFYVFTTPQFQHLFNNTLVQRLIMHFAPAAMFLLGVLI